MTHKETIKKLDELIAYLNSCRGRDIDCFNFEQKIFSSLKDFPISASTRSAICNIRASVAPSRDSVFSMSLEGIISEQNNNTIVALIDILNREKNEQTQAMQDEMQKVALKEQRKGNAIQYRAFWCSIVATIISIIALIVSIIK